MTLDYPVIVGFEARLVAGLFMLVGAGMVIAPRASPGLFLLLILCILAMAAYTRSLTIRLRALRDPAVSLLAFAGWGVLSAAWSLAPLEGLLQAAWLAVVVAGAQVATTRLAREKGFALLLMGGWLVAGFFVGCLYLAHEVATDQSFLLWLLNTFPFLRPSRNKMQLVVDGQVAAISPANLKWSIAGINLLLWPVLLLAMTLWRGIAGLCVAGVLLLGALVLVFTTTHATSQLAILLAGGTCLASLRWPDAVGRLVAAAWVTAVVAVVPLSLLAHQGHLHKLSWMPDTAKQRLEMWNYTAKRVLDAPVLGVGARFSYAEHAAQAETRVEAELAEGGTIDRPLRHPHNLYLQTWYELGAVGAVLLLASGLAMLGKVAWLPLPARAVAHAAWMTGMVELASTWELWQAWLLAAFALSVVAMVLAVRADDAASRMAPTAAKFAAIALPQGLKRPALLLGVSAAVVLVAVGLIDQRNRSDISSRIRALADCRKVGGSDCSLQVTQLTQALASSPAHQSLSRWWPTRFRIYREGDAVVYFRPKCEPQDMAVDLFVLAVWPLDKAILPQDRKQYGFYNHSFYFSGKPYAGAHTGIGYREGDACLAIAMLPMPQVVKIRVGQYISETKTLVWEHEIVFR